MKNIRKYEYQVTPFTEISGPVDYLVDLISCPAGQQRAPVLSGLGSITGAGRGQMGR